MAVPPENGYTVDDFFTLDLSPHTELIDASLVFVSPQRKFHTPAMYLLEQGLRRHVPDDLRVRREMAVELGKRNAREHDRPMVVTYELDPVNRTYISTGVHHDRLELSAPHDIDIDLTAIDEL
ncbi:hypothetical protein [Streptomyces sp. NPDC002205]|uniref:hypothetical protein n=1 Tax=Streptomyces sp. NPDC002205 TaxID=3154411 RepID=UPI0033293294